MVAIDDFKTVISEVSFLTNYYDDTKKEDETRMYLESVRDTNFALRLVPQIVNMELFFCQSYRGHTPYIVP